MHWRMFGCLGICLVFGVVQFGCSNSGTKSSVPDQKAGEQSAKSALPPGMEMPGADDSGGAGSAGMYQGDGGKAADPKKMMPKYQGDYPGIPEGGVPGGAESPKK